MKILIAEDDAVSCSIVKRSVGKLGHECLVAKDSVKAWHVYRG